MRFSSSSVMPGSPDLHKALVTGETPQQIKKDFPKTDTIPTPGIEPEPSYVLLRSSKNAFIILGIFEGYSSVQIWPPPKKNFSGAKLFRANDVISIEHVLCSFHVLPCVLVCSLVEFDLLFAFSVLSLDCASLFIYVHEYDRLCFPMSTEETAVFDCIC